MSAPITFELVCTTPEAVLAAAPGGAHRIELCTHLEVGGLTPSPELLTAAVRQTTLPIHVLVRSTAETFHYSPEIFRSLASSIQLVKTLGAAGIVTGLLNDDDTVDTEHMRELVESAAPLPVTFHRAFDTVPDQFAALEQVIETGCQRILTSGGAPNVLAGAPQLARLVAQAGDRIAIALGGGLRIATAAQVARATGARHFHGSLGPEPGAPDVLEDRIRAMVATLKENAR